MRAPIMARTTYYVMVPFKLIEGELVEGEAIQMKDGQAARSAAKKAGSEADCGAIAFCRSGDPDLGEFDDAEVMCRFGVAPDEYPC
jgi:hypothetical protein